MSDPSSPRSSVVIAKLLDSEGYTDFTANMVKRYWRRNLMDPNRLGRLASIQRAFREQIIPKMTDGDKKVLGRFMSLQGRMSFDTGLRIGLMAALTGPDKDDADHAVRVQLHQLQEEIVRLKDVLASRSTRWSVSERLHRGHLAGKILRVGKYYRGTSGGRP